MKSCLPALILFVFACPVFAQEQEQKLVDRLLRPNTDLRNHSQDKPFLADRSPVTKKATVGAFYWQQKPNEKKFNGTRDFTTSDFNSHPFYAGKNKAKFDTQQARDANRDVTTSAHPSIRSFNARDKAANTRDYPRTRPFLDKGKSQKVLDQKNEPMTIEQVRELLNKPR